jgi:SAM-dependent methyltransferase
VDEFVRDEHLLLVAGRVLLNEQRDRPGFDNVSVVQGYIQALPLDDESVDVVVSNGVINLSTDKAQVFREIARVLTPGGRMAVSDIVTETALSDDIVGNASLWAACIGGAAQQDSYRSMIEAAGLRVDGIVDHPQYRFLSGSAQSASRQYGVKSVSIRAEKPS